MVSGAHMVDFGGSIVASGNGINGISLDSKVGLDLDAASQVQGAIMPPTGCTWNNWQ
jgi:hypothetical protein